MTTFLVKPVTITLKPTGLLLLFVMPAMLVDVEAVLAQDAKPIFDGTLTLKATKLSSAEEALMKSNILPAADKAWHERDGECESGLAGKTAIDIAKGSFTKPKSAQKAILYNYCATGQNMALDGSAIIENGQVVAHLVYEGGWNPAIGALPDIDGNGLSEILIASGGTNQGITCGAISLIELSGDEIRKFGQTNTLSDDCGVNEKNCKIDAYRISVKVGKTPAFYRDVFVDKGTGTWRKSGRPMPISLEKDEVEYELLK